MVANPATSEDKVEEGEESNCDGGSADSSENLSELLISPGEKEEFDALHPERGQGRR